MPTVRRIEIGESVIPEEAIALIEDMRTLDLILTLLEKLNTRTWEEQKMVRRVSFIVASMHTLAEENLRLKHLAGKPIRRPRRNQQTLAEVWKMILDGRENFF